MLFSPDNPDDVAEHEAHHDKIVNGLAVSQPPERITIWSDGDMAVWAINSSSPKAVRNHAEEVGRIARRDAGYGAEVLFTDLTVTVFLLLKGNRIIGFLPIDKRDRVWATSWSAFESNNIDRDCFVTRPVWCVCMVWVLAKYRGSKYASLLLRKAMDYLGCAPDNLAWYVPPVTDAGKAFIRRHCPDQFHIAR